MTTSAPHLKPSPRTVSRIWCISWISLLLSGVAFGQKLQNATKDPHISYIYPAGAQRGTTATIAVGGQYLEGADRVYISGEGVSAKVTGYDRPLSIGEVVRMRNRLQQMGEELGITDGGRLRGKDLKNMLQQAEAAGISAEDIKKMGDHGKMRRTEKIQDHPQVAETVSVEITVAPDAKPGRRELRVFRDGRLSAPLAFYIGDYPEHTEADGKRIIHSLPVVINGQIMPSETDRFSFRAKKGDQLVAACRARELIPHLADAVPGWFQAVMTLSDEKGNEVAYADDYRFNPDPALYFEIPATGTYTLEIKDSIYRGRQDFVYRITLGEIPFVTSIFPLGGKSGEKTAVKLDGENLRRTKVSVGDETQIDSIGKTRLAYPAPFAQSSLTERLETENEQTMPVELGCVINGKINAPGDRDVFAIQLEEGAELLAEVTARRLNSPLDSVLMITDASGQQLAYNNDCEDRSLGRVTHHADARIVFSAPQTGRYHIHLGDIQNAGGSDYAYRLQLSQPEPGYALRITPSKLNGAPGSSVPVTVYALRKDGFDGAIDLKLANKISGLRLDGARIPAGQEKVELTVTLPEKALDAPVALNLQGRATINGKSATRSAAPAEDMMQAFIYHHLVTVDELLISNIKSGAPRTQSKWRSSSLKLKPGKSITLSCKTPTELDPAQRGLKVEPHHFPPGIKLAEALVKDGAILITLTADKEINRELEGNLIFDLFIERTKPSANQKRDGKREPVFLPAGSLPAIPFKIH